MLCQDERLSPHGGWHSPLRSSVSPPLCSKSSGSAALLALTWTCLLVRIVFPSKAKRQGDTWNKLVGPLPLELWGQLYPWRSGIPPTQVLSRGARPVVGRSAVGIPFCSLAFPSGSVSAMMLRPCLHEKPDEARHLRGRGQRLQPWSLSPVSGFDFRVVEGDPGCCLGHLILPSLSLPAPCTFSVSPNLAGRLVASLDV